MPSYELIRSSRRTLALEVTRDGRVLVRAPARLDQKRIDDFVARHAGWIETHQAIQRERRERRPEPTPDQQRELIARAKAVLPEKTAYYGGIMGLRPAGVTITGAEKRFGSCSAKNRICFSCSTRRRPSTTWWSMSWPTSSTRTTARRFTPAWRRSCQTGGPGGRC